MTHNNYSANQIQVFLSIPKKNDWTGPRERGVIVLLMELENVEEKCRTLNRYERKRLNGFKNSSSSLSTNLLLLRFLNNLPHGAQNKILQRTERHALHT